MTIDFGFNGTRRGAPARQRAGQGYAPGSPERAELKARLKEMAAERIDIPLVIGGKERPQRRDRQGGDAARPRPRARRLAQGVEGARGAGDRGRGRGPARVGALALGGPRRRLPQGRRAAGHAPGAPRSTRPPCSASRRRPSRPRSTRPPSSSTSGASTRTTRRSSTPSSRSPARAMWNQLDYRPLEGFVYAVTPFNFTSIARQPPHRARPHGQHRRVEAGLLGDPERLLHPEAARGGRPACRASSTSCPATPRPSPTSCSTTATSPASTSPARPRSSTRCGARSAPRWTATAPTRASWARPAARTSSWPTPRPTRRPSRWPIVRGGFEYQGQKCSAASRVYVPQSIWKRRARPRSWP